MIWVILSFIFAFNCEYDEESVVRRKQPFQKLTGYDNKLSLKMCTYSFAAYQGQSSYPNINAWNCSGCCPLINSVQKAQYFTNSTTDIFGYVAYDNSLDAVVLAFRGTVDIINWISNLNFSTLAPFPKYPSVQVHSGFYDDYTSVDSQVVNLVHSFLSSFGTSTLYVTGHSLGAALAQLAAISFKMDNPSITTHVYSYGTPRTGDQPFSSFYSTTVDESYRITHWHDVVPHLPLLILGFYHTPNEAWFDEAFDSFTYCSDAESPNCSDSVFPDSIDDHLHYFNMDNDGCTPS